MSQPPGAEGAAATEDPATTSLKRRVYELLDAFGERLSLSFAIYEPGAAWAKLYQDAGRDTLCGYARRAGPTSGRCRDEEAELARLALSTGKVQRSACWQGTMRTVVPLPPGSAPRIAVALCGFSIDAAARDADYLPQDIAVGLGLDGKDASARARAFPGDSLFTGRPALVIGDLVVLALEGLAKTT